MALEKKTIKIIAIVVATIIAAALLLGLLLGLLLRSDKIELQVWPRGADGSAEPLITYKSTDPKTYMPWVNRTNDFLKKYRSPGPNPNIIACDYNGQHATENKFCDVDLKDFHPCTSEKKYNYDRAAPCIFLRLDKIFDWTPKPYNTTEDLPSNMDDDLKRFIKPKVGNPEANEVWVSCDGVDPVDKEKIGPVEYFPRHGLPTYYFPYKNQEGYLSPLVAVLFQKPKTGIVIHVECKAWAQNIACADCEPSASVRFQLLID